MDLSDANLIENNRIYDVAGGIIFNGGDKNIVRNNLIFRYKHSRTVSRRIEINSYDDQKTDYPVMN